MVCQWSGLFDRQLCAYCCTFASNFLCSAGSCSASDKPCTSARVSALLPRPLCGSLPGYKARPSPLAHSQHRADQAQSSLQCSSAERWSWSGGTGLVLPWGHGAGGRVHKVPITQLRGGAEGEGRLLLLLWRSRRLLSQADIPRGHQSQPRHPLGSRAVAAPPVSLAHIRYKRCHHLHVFLQITQPWLEPPPPRQPRPRPATATATAATVTATLPLSPCRCMKGIRLFTAKS